MNAAKKSTYVPVKKIRSASFRNGDAKLSIVLAEGKSALNLKATFWKDEEADAETGGRQSFQDQDQAIEAFEKMVKEATKAGWTIAGASRNSFTAIPAPPTQKKGSLKHVAQ